MLNAAALGKTNTVDCKPVASQHALILVEEAFAIRGIVGHQKEDDDGGHDRGNTFKNLLVVSQSLGTVIRDTPCKLTKSHLHPGSPPTSSMWSVITPAKRPEMAPAIGTDV
jgi:hypothetical protein